MNRSEVARLADGATGLGRRDADATLKAVLDAIEEALTGGRDGPPARHLYLETPPFQAGRSGDTERLVSH